MILVYTHTVYTPDCCPSLPVGWLIYRLFTTFGYIYYGGYDVAADLRATRLDRLRLRFRCPDFTLIAYTGLHAATPHVTPASPGWPSPVGRLAVVTVPHLPGPVRWTYLPAGWCTLAGYCHTFTFVGCPLDFGLIYVYRCYDLYGLRFDVTRWWLRYRLDYSQHLRWLDCLYTLLLDCLPRCYL